MWPSQYPLKDLDSSMGSNLLTRMLPLTYKSFSPLQILCRLPSPQIKVASVVYNDCPPSYIVGVWSGRDEKRLANHLGSSRRAGDLQGSGCWGTMYPRALPSKGRCWLCHSLTAGNCREGRKERACPSFSALPALISAGKVPTLGSTGQAKSNSQLINGQPLTRQQRPRCSRNWLSVP